jgi:hypothetical protein
LKKRAAQKSRPNSIFRFFQPLSRVQTRDLHLGRTGADHAHGIGRA